MVNFDVDFFEDIEFSKRFNTTGVCVPEKHYMVNINLKLKEIIKLIQNDSYFVINRPRQYGKTTTLSELERILKSRYKVISLDFELLDTDFENESRFCESLIEFMSISLGVKLQKVDSLSKLSRVISDITLNEEIILIIDEVDKASNNKLFLNFLGMLRSLYLSRNKGINTIFKSVILAGVHDIKNLKIKFRDNTDTKYNSPWNIAVNFNVDMSFNIEEIGTMLKEYSNDNNLNMNILKISKEIYKFTSGYPFLVSRLCQIIDEDLIGAAKREWEVTDVQKAVKTILIETNTLFDDLIKNLENNEELYNTIKQVILGDSRVIYNPYNPSINLGIMFGYFSRDEENYIKISNLIFSELILDYITSKISTEGFGRYTIKQDYLLSTGELDIKKVLIKFSEFMRSAGEKGNNKFLEDDGRLLL